MDRPRPCPWHNPSNACAIASDAQRISFPRRSQDYGQGEYGINLSRDRVIRPLSAGKFVGMEEVTRFQVAEEDIDVRPASVQSPSGAGGGGATVDEVDIEETPEGPCASFSMHLIPDQVSASRGLLGRLRRAWEEGGAPSSMPCPGRSRRNRMPEPSRRFNVRTWKERSLANIRSNCNFKTAWHVRVAEVVSADETKKVCSSRQRTTSLKMSFFR